MVREDGTILRSAYHKAPAPFPALSSMAALGGCQPSAVCGVRGDATAACAATGEFPKEFPITTTSLAALHDVVEVASTASAACALSRDGAVRCWGDNGFAQNSTLTGARELAAGDRRICAVLSSGAVACVDDSDPAAPAKTVIAAP